MLNGPIDDSWISIDVAEKHYNTAVAIVLSLLLPDSAHSGPLIIGGEARWKISKIWVVCTDKISKISPNMFGL